MKYISSLILLISIAVNAREIVVINFHPARIADAKFVASTLENQLSIPAQFITLHSGECTLSKYAVTTLCVLESGEIEVKQIKKEVMSNMLNAFGEANEAL